MKDSVVMVTGGAGNIGRAVTREFLERGARVAVPIYKTDTVAVLDELQASYPDRLNTFALDLTTERGSQQAVQRVVEWAGRLDTVAHMVGGYSGGQRLADADISVWSRMMDLNLNSAWLIARASIPLMLQGGGGSMVFISARAARKGRRGHAAYAVSKSALLTLVEAIAEEYGGEGVRANAVLPGTVDTEANRRAMPDADHSAWTSAEEIARVIYFLASPAAAAVNGAAVPVFGRS